MARAGGESSYFMSRSSSPMLTFLRVDADQYAPTGLVEQLVAQSLEIGRESIRLETLRIVGVELRGGVA